MAIGVMESIMVGLDARRGVWRIAVFVAVSVTFGVGGVTFGVAGGIAGVAGVLGSMAENVAAAMVGGVAFGVNTSVMSGAVRVMGVAFGVIYGVKFGVELGVAVGLIASVAWGLGAMRLPFYLFEILPAVLVYRRSSRSGTPERELRRSPVYFDDLLILPQPFLAALLLPVLRADLRSGLVVPRRGGEQSLSALGRTTARCVGCLERGWHSVASSSSTACSRSLRLMSRVGHWSS